MSGRANAARGRRLGAALAAILLVAATLLLLRGPLLRTAARFLTVQDPLARADVILVLAGDLEARPPRAAELHRDGIAPRVVLIRPEDRAAQRVAGVPNEADLSRRILAGLGVPDSAIVVIGGEPPSTSTREDARIFAAWAARERIRSAVVVTSAYHTRRARWALRRALPDSLRLMMAPAAHARFDETNWWRSEEGLLIYVTEYLKFLHNLLNR